MTYYKKTLISTDFVRQRNLYPCEIRQHNPGKLAAHFTNHSTRNRPCRPITARETFLSTNERSWIYSPLLSGNYTLTGFLEIFEFIFLTREKDMWVCRSQMMYEPFCLSGWLFVCTYLSNESLLSLYISIFLKMIWTLWALSCWCSFFIAYVFVCILGPTSNTQPIS